MSYISIPVPAQARFNFRVVLPVFAVLAVMSAFAFATRSIIAKAGAVHLPLSLLMLLQSAMSLPMLWLVAVHQKVTLKPSNVSKSLYFWRVLFGITTTIFTFWALSLMPAGLASTFAYTAPLFLALLAPYLLKERSNALTLGLLVVGFGGVALAAHPFMGALSMGALGVGLLTGLSGALMQIGIRKLAAAGENSVRSVFWMHATTVVIAIVWCAFSGAWSVTPAQVVGCLVIAALSCIAQLCNVAAYAHGKALAVNALSLLTLPITVVMAAIVFNEQITVWSLLGMALILPASFLLVWSERRHLRNAHSNAALVSSADLAEEHAQEQVSYPNAEPLYVQEPTSAELILRKLKS